jgi:5-hydroxyisourate hydrolase
MALRFLLSPGTAIVSAKLAMRAAAGGTGMAKGWLTTHVLDTARGLPAAGIAIGLFRVVGSTRTKIATAVTNADGRTDQPILPADKFVKGTYELVFSAGDYLRKAKLAKGGGPLFLDEIPIRFGIDNVDAHYHVPLLLSPFGYSTYRGS